MTLEKVFENSHSERLNGIIKNDYIYPYGPDDRPALKKDLKKAIWMYNNEKPHSSLNGLTPVQYRKKMLLITRISLQDISRYQQHIIIIILVVREKKKIMSN